MIKYPHNWLDTLVTVRHPGMPTFYAAQLIDISEYGFTVEANGSATFYPWASGATITGRHSG